MWSRRKFQVSSGQFQEKTEDLETEDRREDAAALVRGRRGGKSAGNEAQFDFPSEGCGGLAEAADSEGRICGVEDAIK